MAELPTCGELGSVGYRGYAAHFPPQLFYVLRRLIEGPATANDIAIAAGLGEMKTKRDWWAAVAAIRRLRLAIAQLPLEAFPFEIVTYWGWGYELRFKQFRGRSERDRENARRRAKTETFRQKRRIYMAAYRNRRRRKGPHIGKVVV